MGCIVEKNKKYKLYIIYKICNQVNLTRAIQNVGL